MTTNYVLLLHILDTDNCTWQYISKEINKYNCERYNEYVCIKLNIIEATIFDNILKINILKIY